MSKQETHLANEERRKFVGATAAAVAGVSLLPGVRLLSIAEAKPVDQAISSDNRWGLLIDTNKCASGCDACVSACDKEHNLEKIHGEKTDAQWIRKVEIRNKETGRSVSLPLMCQHCESPPCVDVCPTGASFRRDDGIVLVDKHICIGCRYCMMACPYKARSFIHEELLNQVDYAPRGKGTVESCTLCVHRVDEDTQNKRDPACVEACNAEGHQAMFFGDLKDKNSEISKQLKNYPSTQIRADLNLNTGVRYRGL